MKFTNSLFYKEILVHFRNYLGGNIASQALAVISLPVLTRLLSSGEYGTYSVFISYCGILSVAITLNVHTAVGRYYYEKNDDFPQFLGTTLSLAATLLIFNTLIIVLFRRSISQMTNLPISIIFLMPVFLLTLIINNIFQQIFQARSESRFISIVGVFRVYGAFIVGVTIILLYPKYGYLGLIFAQIFVGVLISCYIVLRIKPFIAVSFSVSHVKYIINYSVPLMPYALSSVILDSFDRIMINSYLGSSKAGLYSLAYNIGTILSTVSGTLYQAWMPSYFNHMNKGEYRQIDITVNKLFRLVVLAAGALILFGQDLGRLLASQSYHQSLPLIPVIVTGYVFAAIFPIYAWNMGYAYKTFWGSAIVFLAGASNIMLNIFFIPQYGYQAAAYTTLVSYIIMSVLAWVANILFIKTHCVPITHILRSMGVLMLFLASLYSLRLLIGDCVLSFVIRIIIFITLFIVFVRPLLKESVFDASK